MIGALYIKVALPTQSSMGEVILSEDIEMKCEIMKYRE